MDKNWKDVLCLLPFHMPVAVKGTGSLWGTKMQEHQNLVLAQGSLHREHTLHEHVPPRRKIRHAKYFITEVSMSVY